jgi:hypothetical protein
VFLYNGEVCNYRQLAQARTPGQLF